jgi:hypothetical protein
VSSVRDRGDRGPVMRGGSTITLRERLHVLAAFLPEFEKPGFEFGQWVTPLAGEPGVTIMPFFTQGPVAESLYRTCDDMGWVLQGFDWPAWNGTPEATQLRDSLHSRRCVMVNPSGKSWEQATRHGHGRRIPIRHLVLQTSGLRHR